MRLKTGYEKPVTGYPKKALNAIKADVDSFERKQENG